MVPNLVRFTPNLVRFAPNLVRFAPNNTNLGLFRISFSTFWLGEPKCTETDPKKSKIWPI